MPTSSSVAWAVTVCLAAVLYTCVVVVLPWCWLRWLVGAVVFSAYVLLALVTSQDVYPPAGSLLCLLYKLLIT
jgi:hypothetical protein